jgi:hypothetical protein
LRRSAGSAVERVASRGQEVHGLVREDGDVEREHRHGDTGPLHLAVTDQALGEQEDEGEHQEAGETAECGRFDVAQDVLDVGVDVAVSDVEAAVCGADVGEPGSGLRGHVGNEVRVHLTSPSV